MTSKLPDLNSLAAGVIQHDAALRDALQKIESVLDEDSAEAVIRHLSSKPGLLEYILSASDAISKFCSRYILTHFPVSAEAFGSSLCCVLLRRFWAYLFSIRRVLPPETARTLDGFRESVEKAPPVLKLLAETISLLRIGAHKKSKGNKQFIDTFNAEDFDKLGLRAPSTPQAADELAARLLQTQRRVLEVYFGVLRNPKLSSIIKKEYILQDPPFPSDKVVLAKNPSVSETVADPPAPSGHLAVQPMKATLYFESANGFGDWRIILNTRAIQNLREARRADPAFFKIIVKKMKELSIGHFSDDNQKRLNGPNDGVPIYEAKISRDRRLVYQIDCVTDFGSNGEFQAIRMFGVYNHTQLDRLWESMGTLLARKGEVYRRKCNFRTTPKTPGDKSYTPARFPVMEETDSEPESSALNLPHEDLKELHSLLVLQKFNNFSQALLNSIIADRDIAHVFLISPREQRIVDHTSSCYVIGRSGTGKTTTMMFKMLGIENAWNKQGSVDLPRPRQLFVTQSRILAGKVGDYFSDLVESLEIASKSLPELAELAKTAKIQREQTGLGNPDDDVHWRNDLPDRFSLLEDKHYPLFITFDKLCQLLEVDFFGADADDGHLPRRGALNPKGRNRGRSGSFVSYTVFRQAYWSHFAESLTKHLDPALVFGEILGVIKGSEAALHCSSRFLDQDRYENLSYRAQSTLASHRRTVYAIFQSYQRLKRDRGDYDAADRTHFILDALQVQNIPGQRIDYLFVDEVQDNLLIDAQILRMLCRNPDGLFWAGDTAQSISVGSSFRFDDLKSFLFRVEERNHLTGNMTHKVTVPTSFQLAVNYRSHGGIINCAHSVIEIITMFWPYAIDRLAPERGIIDGPKPVFFHGWDSDKGFKQFFTDIKLDKERDQIEFGADQCILVRDDKAKNKLCAELGQVGLIMTLYDSKGLEFNDVLLYSFFEDSTADLSQWRVVLNAMKSHRELEDPVPSFDDTRHAGICNELKFLYVAITRARKNFWIIDCSEKAAPMRALWTNKDQVTSCIPGDNVPQLAIASTAEDWAKRGTSLFTERRYIYAMESFKKAKLDYKASIAEAYYLRDQARATPIWSGPRGSASSKHAFLIAAEAFLFCAAPATGNIRITYMLAAGECFIGHGDDSRAADAYLDAQMYTLAAQLCRKVGRFDDAVDIIQNHHHRIPLSVAESILDIARLFYFKNARSRDESTVLSKATKLFPTLEKALEFAEDYDLDAARVILLLANGKPAEAAEIHILEGRIQEGIQILLDKLTDQVCPKSAVPHVIRALWKHLSFGISPAGNNPLLGQWLHLAAQIDRRLITGRECDEICMFEAMVAGNVDDLERLGLKFNGLGNKAAALCCLDQVFAAPPQIEGASTIEETVAVLETFFVYTNLLHDATCLALDNPRKSQTAQKLFAFEMLGEDVFAITHGAILYSEVVNQGIPFTEDKDGKRTVSWRGLSHALKTYLSERLKHRVIEENQICRRAKLFSPCLDALVGSCSRFDCQRCHVSPATLTPRWYNYRIRMHLLQIQIYQNLHFIDIGSEEGRQKMYWLDCLYEALNPYIYHLGCRANLDLTRIPGAANGLRVVNDWVKYVIHMSDPWKHWNFLTTFSRAAALGLEYGGDYVLDDIQRAQCMTYTPPLDFILRKADNWYIMHGLVAFLHGVQPSSISEGVLFVKRVVEEMLPINASLLCDIIERLCCAFVVCWRLQRLGTLHDVILPRSWLLDLLKGNNKTKRLKTTTQYGILYEPIFSLVRRMHTGFGTEHLYHENRDLTKQFATRHAFIHRLCRALCLLTYNIGDDKHRDRISREFASLNKQDRPLPIIYRQYFEAKHWDDLVAAVEESTTGSPMDEIVHLFLQSQPQNNLRTMQGVRRVVFRTSNDIPYILGFLPRPPLIQRSRRGGNAQAPTDSAFIDRRSEHVDVPADSLLRNQDEPLLVDEHTPSDQASNSLLLAGGPDIKRVEGQDEIEELATDPDLGPEDLTRFLAGAGDQHAVNGSSEEIAAACVIQAVYRRRLSRRRHTARIGKAEARSRHFLAYLAVSERMEWPRGHGGPSYYRAMFLGPLPHLFLCLERAQNSAFDSKAKAKKRLISKAGHEHLEDVHAEMTKANLLLNGAIRLKKVLEPTAAFHLDRDVAKLRDHVKSAEMLIRSLPCAQELQEDIDIAVKGIVKQASQTKKRRPKLNMENDDEYDYMN